MGSGKRAWGTVFVGFLWIIQSVGRLSFAAVGTPTGMGQFLDAPISDTISFVLFMMFLLLGVFGLIAAFGLLARRKWGFWGTIFVSVTTIAFDIWGLTIQFTAAIGLIVPLISILYLYPKKSQLFATMLV
ncbi:MAG: hypothetical protein ACPLRY_03370 [Candidatus Bathyarchaeales archaeon]